VIASSPVTWHLGEAHCLIVVAGAPFLLFFLFMHAVNLFRLLVMSFLVQEMEFWEVVYFVSCKFEKGHSRSLNPVFVSSSEK
jgi:hypothetical protein